MQNITYGYARVSTTDQNLDRQLIQLEEFGIPARNILCDKLSGKDFNRKAWNTLVGTDSTTPLLREGDLLVVISLDRLGRNYQEIQQQWKFITGEIKADIKVLDMPLLDTSVSKDSLDKRFIADLVLQILSYTAEKERVNNHIRQEQGIAAAKAKGVKFGRPSVQKPYNWDEVYSRWMSGEITATVAIKELGMKRTSFYNLVKSVQAEDLPNSEK